MRTEPPERKNDADYHYHAYDYKDAKPWEALAVQPKYKDNMFYSMVADLEGLRSYGEKKGVPNITRPNVGGPTLGSRNIIALSFGNRENLTRRPTVVITGGIHAREWAAAEMTYLLAEYLIRNYPSRNPADKYEEAIKQLVDTRNIYIIPMLNPDGNNYTVFGDDPTQGPVRLWRKNRRPLPGTSDEWVKLLARDGVDNWPFKDVRDLSGKIVKYKVPDYDPAHNIPPASAKNYRDEGILSQEKYIGVDLNRNFETRAWGYDCAPTYSNCAPYSETYFGPEAKSETETANIQGLVDPLNGVATTIDYHSYGQLILYPDEASGQKSIGPDYRALGVSLKELIASKDGKHYRLGGPDLLGYLSTGTNADYMARQKQARAFTIELDPQEKDPGFLLPETRLMALFETNIRGALAAIAAPAREVAGPALGKVTAVSKAINPYLAWDVYGRGNQLPVKNLLT